jgi:hypothetical protein
MAHIEKFTMVRVKPTIVVVITIILPAKMPSVPICQYQVLYNYAPPPSTNPPQPSHLYANEALAICTVELEVIDICI